MKDLNVQRLFSFGNILLCFATILSIQFAMPIVVAFFRTFFGYNYYAVITAMFSLSTLVSFWALLYPKKAKEMPFVIPGAVVTGLLFWSIILLAGMFHENIGLAVQFQMVMFYHQLLSVF